MSAPYATHSEAAPPRPGWERVGVPWELDRTGREGGSVEAWFSATMKRSGIKYNQNLLAYTVSLTGVGQLAERRSAEATLQWARRGEERRGVLRPCSHAAQLYDRNDCLFYFSPLDACPPRCWTPDAVLYNSAQMVAAVTPTVVQLTTRGQ